MPKFKPNIAFLLISSTFILSFVSLLIAIFILPSFNSSLTKDRGILLFLLFLSYLIFLFTNVIFGLLIVRNIKSLIWFSTKMASGNLEEQLGQKLFLDFGLTAVSLENLRKNLREKLNSSQEAKNQAEAILFNVGEGVFAVNLKGEIIIFNQMAEKIVGYKEEQIKGQIYSQILQFYSSKTKTSLGSFIDKVLLEGKAVGLPAETILVTAARAEIPVAVNSSPIRNQKGIIVGGIVVFRDISHEKEIEEIRTDLISIASHQLRTPLSEIRGLISLLIDNVAGPLNPHQKEYLDLLSIANDRMINLVNDLLNISRIEQGRIQLNFKKTDLGQLVFEVVKSLELTAKKHKQTLSVTLDPGLPFVTADSDKTKEIISNLVENALKYTFENGTILVRVTKDSNGVWVLVKDNGVGVSPSKQKDLFQKFSRVENPLSKMTTGTGLGLYAVKQLVERQNGKIWFESVEGKGSTFGFFLPLGKG